MFKLFSNKFFLIFLAVINFVVGGYSIQYYSYQLVEINPLLWVFVADCIVYALLFSFCCVLLALKRSNSLLFLISIVGNIKYGLWTLFVLFLGGTFFSYWYVILGHLLLMAEVIILFRKEIFKVKHFLIALTWFLVNDVFDYVFLLHPYIGKADFFWVALFSFIASIVLCFLLSGIFSKGTTKEKSLKKSWKY